MIGPNPEDHGRIGRRQVQVGNDPLSLDSGGLRLFESEGLIA